jgi:hemerythrin-like domain-containing protein
MDKEAARNGLPQAALKPTDVLRHEHKIILVALTAMEKQAKAIEATGKVDGEKTDKMLDFFRNFTDRCHHTKEEKYLFVALEQRGMRHDVGPIAVMLAEHQHGRNRLKAVNDALTKARAGDRPAIRQVRENLAAYVKLLKEHITKEDNVLFVMAEQVLTHQDQKTLSAAFEKVEADEMGQGVHEKYHQLAHELAAS